MLTWSEVSEGSGLARVALHYKNIYKIYIFYIASFFFVAVVVVGGWGGLF